MSDVIDFEKKRAEHEADKNKPCDCPVCTTKRIMVEFVRVSDENYARMLKRRRREKAIKTVASLLCLVGASMLIQDARIFFGTVLLMFAHICEEHLFR